MSSTGNYGPSPIAGTLRAVRAAQRIVDNIVNRGARGDRGGTMVEKLKALMEGMDRPGKDLDKPRCRALLLEVLAELERTEEVPPEVFSVFPAECRKAAMQMMLAIVATTLED